MNRIAGRGYSPLRGVEWFSMKSERIAAGLTWAYAAAFGVPAIPVAAYLLKNGRLPIFLDLFPMYGGP